MAITNIYQENKIGNVSQVKKSEEANNDTDKNIQVTNSPNLIKKDESDSKKYTENDLDKAVNKLNKFLEDEKVHAEYSVHKDLKTTIIRIVENDTKKVVLEVPSEKILDMIASMCRQVGILDKKA